MSFRLGSSLLWIVGIALMAISHPAAADVVVIGKYIFANGDTATRGSYFSRNRARVTAPDGKEFIHDAQGKRVMVIDHAARRYYTGTLAEADSIANWLLLERRKELKPLIEANQERWAQMMKSFNDSIVVEETGETRTIAGYPCTRWTMTAGSYMTHERWVARGLSVANYGPELEKVVMATVLDPLGRQLMRLLIQMREHPGTVLASSTHYQTLTQTGSFSWEASSAKSETIPKTVWDVPAGYTRVKP